MQKLTRLLLFCCFALSWAGADAQDHALTRPMPDSWKYSEGAEQTLPSHDSWWRRFNDPVLDSLISMGEDANFDLITAYHRMEAASRRMTAARADYYPNIGLSAGYTRERLDGANSNRWSLGATAGWQIDVFGKVTAAVKQSKAGYQASRAEWIGAMVSMAGDIAATYMQLRVWQAELAVAQRHAVVQDSITALVEARFDCGLAAKPQLAQARAQAHSIKATIPQLQTSIATAVSSIALLTGRYPSELEDMLLPQKPLPDYRQIVQTGVPSELLRRRPDILAADYQLAAAAAAVGIAKKDFLPTLTLEGTVGVAAPEPGDMFSKSGFYYSVAPTLSWTIFDGFARSANVAAARQEMEQQIASYNSTVINAYNEVGNALVKYRNCLKLIDEYDMATSNAREFLLLSLDLYTRGLSPYSDVATAQQDLLSYNNSLIVARGDALSSLVSLYEALGGGFQQ